MLKWIWLSIAVLFFDQLTKWMAEASLTQGVPLAVMSHLNFTLAYNEGAAFSFLGDQDGWQRWFLSILAGIVSIFILVWMKKLNEGQRWTAIGLALVLGGAVGNLIDRLMYGKVIDFIDFYVTPTGFHFAIFNIADIAITCGAVLLVVISLFWNDELPSNQ